MRPLTLLQRGVLQRLRAAGFHFVADGARDKWMRGQKYYVDTGVNLDADLRADFQRANEHTSM